MRGHTIGLLATGPVDAVETTVDIDKITLKQRGIMGSMIINEQTTMMVDIVELVETVRPEWSIETALAEISDQSQEAISNSIQL